jgi:hypothetical protein
VGRAPVTREVRLAAMQARWDVLQELVRSGVSCLPMIQLVVRDTLPANFKDRCSAAFGPVLWRSTRRRTDVILDTAVSNPGCGAISGDCSGYAPHFQLAIGKSERCRRWNPGTLAPMVLG